MQEAAPNRKTDRETERQREKESKKRAKHEEEERLRKEYIDVLESKNTELVRRLKDRITATKLKQVSARRDITTRM